MTAEPVKIAIRQLPHGAGLPLPELHSAEAAGADLTAALEPEEELILAPGAHARVPCGFQMSLPSGYEAQVRPRSGLAFRHGVTVLNAPGTIDADYRGEVQVLLVNHGTVAFPVRRGDRIAQMVVAPVCRPRFEAVEDLPESERGESGFGSTGVKPGRHP